MLDHTVNPAAPHLPADRARKSQFESGQLARMPEHGHSRQHVPVSMNARFCGCHPCPPGGHPCRAQASRCFQVWGAFWVLGAFWGSRFCAQHIICSIQKQTRAAQTQQWTGRNGWRLASGHWRLEDKGLAMSCGCRRACPNRNLSLQAPTHAALKH